MRAVLLLGHPHRPVHAAQPLGRVVERGSGSGGQHQRDPVAAACPSASSVRTDTGTAATSGPSRQRVVVEQPAPQRAGAQRHHDVVDGDAVRRS